MLTSRWRLRAVAPLGNPRRGDAVVTRIERNQHGRSPGPGRGASSKGTHRSELHSGKGARNQAVLLGGVPAQMSNAKIQPLCSHLDEFGLGLLSIAEVGIPRTDAALKVAGLGHVVGTQATSRC